MRALARRLRRIEERLAPRDGEPRCSPAEILRERMCRQLSQERGVPYEDVYREEKRAFDARMAKQMAGYKGDGSPASVMRWLILRRREAALEPANDRH